MRRAWILGGGPTLPEDLSPLSRTSQFTVGLNHITRRFQPSVHFFMDDLPAVVPVGGVVSVGHVARNPNRHVDYRLPSGTVKWDGPTPLDHRLIQIRAISGPAAARWALAMGFERVTLLGFGGVGTWHSDVHNPGYDKHLQQLLRTLGQHIDRDQPLSDLSNAGWSESEVRALMYDKLGPPSKPGHGQTREGPCRRK